ncbi:MAG: class I SAM-dependent methyltransferase [Geodermatophilaceae bacterium]|nr:class I SAM-dependent methyltransferase [Geodermatophilaceae bacterium]
MNVRGSLTAGLAKQLGAPTGLRGRLVGAMLNRANRNTVAQAVAELSLPSDAFVADVGFGGGIGLQLLLDEVAGSGQVHGVELSETMLASAARRHRGDIEIGRLHLHEASMTRLPLPDHCLDGVLSINTIYFVADLGSAFAEFARVVKGTGRVALGLGDPTAMHAAPYTAHGFRIRPVSDVIDQLGAAGLTVERDVRVGSGADAVHLLVATPLARTSGSGQIPGVLPAPH